MENLDLNSFNPESSIYSPLGLTDPFAQEQSFLRTNPQLSPSISLEIPSVSPLALSPPLEPPVREILGTAGRDILIGTVENERFVGGQGADIITGGLGNDIFVYQTIRDAGDTLKDFERGKDKIDLTLVLQSLGYTGFNPLQEGYVQFSTYSAGTVVSLDNDGKGPLTARPYLYVETVQPTQLTSLDFFPNSGEPPTITASLVNDTGASPSDRLTYDPSITGKISYSSSLSSVKAQLNGQPVEILSQLLSDGKFTLNTAQLTQINGGSLSDGQYTLKLTAQDIKGNASQVYRYGFALDRTAPSLSLGLDPSFDSAPVGDFKTTFETATLVGTTEANLIVWLQPGGVSATANGLGRFSFSDRVLSLGNNTFALLATDLAGNQGQFSQTIERLPLQINKAPTGLSLTPVSLAENSGDNRSVGTFSTQDPDVGDSHSYSLVTGTGDRDNSAFTIVGNELRIKNSPNFEEKSIYTVRVRTTDAGGLSYEKAFTVSITNVNESPTELTLSGNAIAENSPTNALIGTFNSQDPDVGDSHTYGLVGGTGDRDNSAFTIVGNELRIIESANFEEKSIYSIRVRTTDAGGLSYEKAFTVNITNVNEAPSFTSTSINTAEVGTIYRYEITTVDPESDRRTINATNNLPIWLTLLDNGDGTALLSGTPTINDLGITPFNLVVKDVGNLTATQPIMLSTAATLREATNFSPQLIKPITIPSQNAVLKLTIDQLSFDASDLDSINDAFEIALLDNNGNSLVYTINTGKDAFFNQTEGEPQALAAGVTVAGKTVSLNLGGIAAGTQANLVFRLVNNDQDTASYVRINQLEILANGGAAILGVTPQDISARINNPLNFNHLSDVSGSTKANYGQTAFNQDTQVLSAELAIENSGTYGLDAPLIVAVTNLSDPTVQVFNPDGFTPQGLPYFDFSDRVSGGKLEPGQLTGKKTITFKNPQGNQFTYDLRVLSELNANPVIQSKPVTEVIAGQRYHYDVNATDADSDPLTYRLAIAPIGMTIDPNTGVIEWQTTSGDIGNRNIRVEVSDGRGGSDRQDYTLSAISSPPNRPPAITSLPIVDTRVSQNKSGKIIVANDEWTLSDFGFSNAPEDAKLFAQNIVNYFTGGEKGSFLGYSNNFSFTGSKLAEALISDGHQWTVNTNLPFTLETLQQYDGVFVGGFPADNQVLIDYVNKGGNVYITAGTGVLGGATGEANVWKDFLNNFGLSFTNQFNNIQGTIPINPSPHPIFSRVKKLYQNNGNTVIDLDANDNQGILIAKSNNGQGLYAVYDPNFKAQGAYIYDVEAIDPDSDILTYELVKSPTGIWIEPETGIIRWLPNARQIGLQDITVKVSDGKGGSAEQKYQILVQQEAENTPPIIISDPVTRVYPISNISDPQLFDLSKWSVVQYEFNDQPDASWQIQSGKTIVEQKINADASILLSNTDVTNNRIEGAWRVGTSDDDDYIGFVFGYQNPQHFYLFDWKQADQNDPLGFAERGMSIKVVDANSSLTGTDLWPTNGNGQRVKQLFHNTVTWKDLTDYKFTLDFLPGQFTITVKEGNTIIESVTINDNTYTSGKFGFYNYSQSNVLYSGFTQQALPSWNYSYDVDAVDADKDNLTYSLIDKPTGMTINPDSGLITWNPIAQASQFNVKVKVEDGRGGFDTQSFVIELADRNVDLTLADIHTESLVVDGQLLTVSGQVSAQIKNQGLNDLTDRFKVVFFEDRNINQAYDLGIDTILGETQVNTPLQAGQSTTVTTNLSGFLSFINSPIWAFVDADKVITETNENNNLAFSSQDCMIQPSGQFNPVVEWNKNTFSVLPSSNQVMMTPAVIDLNGDKIPDIVFTTYTGQSYVIDGNLRAISGADGRELWTVTNPLYEVQGASGVAVGDIDNDGKPEIVTVAENGEALIAFEHDGTFKWRSPNFWTGIPSRGGISQWGSASIADLNQDGTPEIILGSTVLDNQGKILWQGTSVGGLGQGSLLYLGQNLGALSVVADLDLDGIPEVIAGKSAYRANGSLYWNAAISDGFSAIGNFDSDPNPEIVVVSNGQVYLLEHTGQIKWGGVSIPGGGVGGAPTIADIDGDGQPEIGVAGATRYVVLEADGSIKWTSVTQDNSSNVTGSSVFDFNGDGKAEIVYGDEVYLRIYNGSDGQILYQLPKSSATTYELPVIVDVDADGNAEIVAVANNSFFGSQTGIFVIGDLNDTWVSTRQIWNQHSYHITNINDDGSIPIREENSWQTHNTYRLNLQTNYNPLAAPDLTASYLRTEEANGKTTIKARIGNGGSIFVASGVNVAFYKGDPKAGGILLGTTKTTKKLEIGAFEDVSLTVNGTSLQNIWVVADDDGTGKGQVNECDEENNRYSEVFVNGRGEIRGTKWEDINGDGVKDSTSNSKTPTPIKLTQLSTLFNNAVGIDYHEPTNSVIISANYPNGQPKTFERILFDGTHVPFSDVSGLTDEVKIATVKTGGVGNFTVGDLFVGNGVDGQIIKITNNGLTVINPWVDLPGNNNGLMRGSLYIDQTGVFNGDLIAVTSTGQVWQIDSQGNQKQLASLGTHLEGLFVVPNDVNKYGPLAGKIVTGAEDQTRLYTIDPQGMTAFFDVGVKIEDIDLVEPNENFYGINFGTGKILAAPASQFSWMVGDILLTQEVHSKAGLYRLFWNGNTLKAEELSLTPDSQIPGQWEHVTFAPVGLVDIPQVEPGLASVTVYLDLNNNGLLDPNEPSQITASDNPNTLDIDETGQYRFTNLTPGSYIVREVVPEGFRQTFPTTLSNRIITNVEVKVTGTSDPWLAGMPDGARASIEDVAPAQSPAIVPGLQLNSGSILTFAVTGGQVGYGPGGSSYISLTPDGTTSSISFQNHVTQFSRTDGGAENGISGLFAPINSLIGVFIGSGQPNNGVTPNTLDFRISGNITGGINYTTISPQLKQAFFIGDGLNTEGKRQQIIVPNGATRLFLGTMDGFGWWNNVGFYDVSVTESLSEPQPSFHTVTLTSGQIVKNINFGNTKTNEIKPNQAPIFTSTAPITAQIDQLLRYNSIAIDPDNDRLTFDLPLKPEGMVVDETTGILVWKPTLNQSGIHDVILRVQDGKGGISLQSFQLKVDSLNNAPNIISNPDLEAVANLPYQYQIRAQDADGDAIAFRLDTAPTGATFDATTGILRWTPTIAQLGQHNVQLTVRDDQGAETSQAYILRVVAFAPNHAPEITSTPRNSVALGTSYFYALNTSDPDGDPLTISLQTAPTGITLNQEGFITWTPEANQLGNHTVKIQVADGRGGIAEQEFAIAVLSQRSNNQAPQILSTPTLQASINQIYQYNLVGKDPDGDPILWSLESRPDGMSLDVTNGTIRWQPKLQQIGLHEVVVQAIDTQGATTSQRFTLAVNGVNLPPTITSVPLTQSVTNQPYIYTVIAKDPENGRLTYSLGRKPNNMTIDSTGKLQWTPTQTGIYDIDVLVTDNQGATTTQTYRLVVGSQTINQAPTITSSPGFVANVGNPYQYQLQASDPDGQPITYKLLNAPQGMAIDANSGLVQWTTPITGNYKIVVAAFDPEGLGVTQGYTLTAKVNSLPVIRSTTPPSGAIPGVAYRYDIQASDPDGGVLIYSLDADSQGKGITVDERGRLTWTPSVSQAGTHAITLTITDAAGGKVTQSFNLTVAPDTTAPKVVINRSKNFTNKGESVSFQVSATDNVGIANLQLLINNTPVVVDSNGVAAFTPVNPGVITAKAVAIDVAGNKGEATTTVNVLDPTDTEAPAVSLDLSGIKDDEITAPTQIKGTVNDTNLDYYVLEVAPADGSAPFKEMFRGTTPVTNGVLGVLDPTLLANDTYQVRLFAYDVNGKGNGVTQLLKVSGDLKLGNFQLSFTDLEIPMGGIPITLTRTYDSLNSNNKDDFGYGWRMEFRDADVRTSLPKDPLYEEYGFRGVGFKEGDAVYITLPGGKREKFTFKLEAIKVMGIPLTAILGRRALFVPTFVADKGSTSTLSVQTSGVVLIRGEGDRVIPFSGGSAFSYYNPQDWGNYYQLTTKEGIVYNIDATTGDINSITNRNGDKLTLTDAGITNSNGQNIIFGRDAQGRITTVTDLMGKLIKYEYDAKGDLIKVSDRENNTTQYKYNNTQLHYLDEIIDPLGRTGIKNEYDENGRLTKVFNAEGKAVQLDYNPDNFVYSVKNPLGYSTTYESDARGNITNEIDALGGITKRTYDENNNLLSETNPEGEKISYTYDSKGNKLSETDALGNITRYTYNAKNDLLTTTDALGNVVTNTYDAKGNVLSLTGQANGKITLAYDSNGLLTTLTTAEGTTKYEYDFRGNITKEIDALGREMTYTYDANGNRLTETRKLSTPNGIHTLVTKSEYDAKGNVIKVTDAEGGITQTIYDAAGQKIKEIDALNRVTKYIYSDSGQLIETIYPDATPTDDSDNPRNRKQYDAANHVIAEIDELGRQTQFQYDALGRLTFTLYPDSTPNNNTDNPRKETRYDKAGRVIAEVDELGNVTRYTYDDAGRRIETILPDSTPNNNADNPRFLVTYDALGRQISQTDPLGHKTQSLYDELGRPIGQIFADGTSIATTFDLAGRVIAKTDQEGNKTQYEYNALGQLTAVIDALKHRTEYDYDELGNLISQKDAKGNVTRYEYDGIGRRIATKLPLNQRSTIQYDKVGHVISTSDFNGQTITFTYDERDRLLSKVLPNNQPVTYRYTLTGQRATETDSNGTITYQYDLRDRLLSRTDPDGVKINYTYDAAGNRISVTIPSGTTSYTFDEQNRLKIVTDPSNGVTTYTYDLAGNLIKATLPNGTTETREYDLLNRLLYLQNSNSSGVFNSFRYTLDKVGNRLTVAEQDGSSTPLTTSRKVNYDYDDLYRLLKEEIIDGTTRTISYIYDAVSNRLTRNDSAEGNTSYEYDNNDRLLKEVSNGVATTYTYDNNGNTLSKRTGTDKTTYQWDAENRLVGVDSDGDGVNEVTNKYDSEGIRVGQTVNGEETRFLVDKNRDYAQVLEEYTPSKIIKASYVYGHDLISQLRNNQRSFYHVDGLGSTRALTDINGLVSDRYAYDAFGEVIKQLGNTQNLYLFAGEQRDPNIGLDYLRARYLDVNTGRFYGRDPFQGFLKLPSSLHSYIYANNNSVNLIDPSGKFFGGLLATVEISTILSSVIPQFTFAALTVVSIKYLIQPGFTLRYGSLDLIADASDPDILQKAEDLYILSGKLIGAGTNFIEISRTLLDIANSTKSIADKVRSIALATNNIQLINNINRAGSTSGLLIDLYDLNDAVGKINNQSQELGRILNQSPSISNQNATNSSNAITGSLKSFFKLVLGILAKVG